MPTFKVLDRASEFRIEIVGRLEGQSIAELSRLWSAEMTAPSPRKCIIDISRLSGYDTAGCKLLREIYNHGAQIAAATPLSLVFLNEISVPRRRGPALVREQPRKREPAPAPVLLRAAGE